MVYRIKDYMRSDIATVDVGDSALAVSKVMLEKGVGQIIVLEKAQPAGIVTERDLVLKVMAKEREASNVKVSEVMSAPVITIDPDASLEEAVKIMAEHGIRRLPVVRDHIIYGIFTSRDLAKHFNEYEDRVARDIVRHCISLPF